MNTVIGAGLSVLTFLGVSSLSAPAAADPPTGRVMIVNGKSNLCLTPAGGNRSLNDPVVQFHCDNDPSRLWGIIAVGGNMFEIANLNSGLCLTVAGGNTSRNDPVVQFACDTDPSRRWQVRFIGVNLFQLVNVNSSLCLTVAGGSTGLNVEAVQFPCDGDFSRNWRFGGPQNAPPPSGGSGPVAQ